MDVVVLIAGAMDARDAHPAGAEAASTVTLAFSSEWASTEQLLELGGAAVEGMVVSQFFERASAPAALPAFKDAYRERFGEEPGFSAVNAYDAVNVVLEVLRRRQGESLRDAMLRIGTYDGLQGALKIDRFGDADRRSHMAVVERGAFQVVEGQ